MPEKQQAKLTHIESDYPDEDYNIRRSSIDQFLNRQRANDTEDSGLEFDRMANMIDE